MDMPSSSLLTIDPSTRLFSSGRTSPGFRRDVSLKAARSSWTPLSTIQFNAKRQSRPVSFSDHPAKLVACSSPPPVSAIAMASQLPPMEQVLLLFSFIMFTMVVTVLGILAVSVPALLATRRVFTSLERLRIIIRSEVPGTLSSLRMSRREINDLMLQLNHLRDGLTDVQFKGQTKRKSTDPGRSKDNPIMN